MRTISILSCLFILFFSVMVTSSYAASKHLNKEKVYQEPFCKALNAQMEYRVKYEGKNRRVDCLNEAYAIEVDFIEKIYEALRQSFLYADATDRTPGIAIIKEKGNYTHETSKTYNARLKQLIEYCKEHGVKLWIITEVGVFKEIA